ncbi:ribonuclease P protein component [Candidatus Falkowbacteria bacterium RIFCSPLOWO2_02_FULL_45_21]|uniref:Ribonuclease P protein component n=1 Tax=Candidatus Falkowbacteria bacterium RIFCSPLOWO2_02_FULL_45_21 TaxID=1797989 RepID=A0A1F5SC53_9BACT|nr:MAG: ribonuclease P protein component [Candidatus Falkowbacteria bacterium RIFCSPLOWO2_02_FULL_45_21]
MFAKQRSLVKQKDFEKIFKQGRAYYTKLLGVKILTNQSNFNRFGIIVGAKVSKKATERNRLKRQLRQAVWELDKKLKPGFDLAVMALPGFLNQTYANVKSELEKIFKGLKIFK